MPSASVLRRSEIYVGREVLSVPTHVKSVLYYATYIIFYIKAKPNCTSRINIKLITGWSQAQLVLIQQVTKLVPYN